MAKAKKKTKAPEKVAVPEPVDVLRPPTSVLAALGSIIVHAEEFLSEGGHPIDRTEFENGLKLPYVMEWFAGMRKLALIPVKRSERDAKPGEIKGFKNVRLVSQIVDDNDAEDEDAQHYEYTLHYTPTCKHGLPQATLLDADNDDNARFEAAGILECKESDLPEIESD